MNESDSKSHKPLFSQTFLGAIIVALVGGVLVWMVTNSFSKRSSESDSGTLPSVERVSSAAPLDPASTPTPSETTPGSTSPPVKPSPSPKKAANECPQGLKCADGFEFSLEKCAPEGGDFNCWFRVTNRGAERTLRVLVDGSTLNDQDENSYEVKRVLASNGKWELIGLNLVLPPDSSKRFGLNFKGLPRRVTSITLLYVRTMDFNIDWRDVEISN